MAQAIPAQSHFEFLAMFLVIPYVCPITSPLSATAFYDSVHRPGHPEISTLVCACELSSQFSPSVCLTMFESLLFFRRHPS